MAIATSALALEKMTVREIARRWAAELSVDWRLLEEKLLAEALEGVFDGLPSGRGLFSYDRETGRHWSMNGQLLREQLQESGKFANLFTAMRDNDGLALHRDAVAQFAARLGIASPSWWPSNSPRDESERRTPGRPKTQSVQVETEMRRVPFDRLSTMLEKEMEAQFRASRAVCRKVRDKLRAENSRQFTPTAK